MTGKYILKQVSNDNIINFEDPAIYKNLDNFSKIMKRYRLTVHYVRESRDYSIGHKTDFLYNHLYLSENLLENLLFGSNKYKNIIRLYNIYKYDGIYYYDICDVIKIIGKLNTHPEHFIMKKILYPELSVENIIKDFPKKLEILCLSKIYEKLNENYKITYQNKIDEYKVDTLINTTYYKIDDYDNLIKGVIIEIDEDDHNDRNSENELIRHNILKTHGYQLIRIPIYTSEKEKYYDDIFLSDFINKYIEEIELILKDQYFVAASTINHEELEKFIEDRNISKDFYKIVGKSLEHKEMYCIHIDDIVKYVEYSRSNKLMDALIVRDFSNIYYKEFKNTEYYRLYPNGNSDAIGNNNRKIHWLFSRQGFYKCLSLINKPNARQCIDWIFQIYEASMKYLKMLNKAKLVEISNRNNLQFFGTRAKNEKKENKQKLLLMKEKYKDKLKQKEKIIDELKKQLDKCKPTEIDNKEFPFIKLNQYKIIKCKDLYNEVITDYTKQEFYDRIEDVFKIKKTKVDSIWYFIGIEIV